MYLDSLIAAASDRPTVLSPFPDAQTKNKIAASPTDRGGRVDGGGRGVEIRTLTHVRPACVLYLH